MDDARTSELKDKLRDSGLRATQPRTQVLGLLEEIKGHHSVDEMVDLLDQRGCALPRASVYGIVHALVHHGILALADAGPGRAMYEVRTTPHHHLVCVECGDIEDVPCVSGETPCVSPPSVVGRVDEAQIIFRGLCEPCSLAANPS